MFNQLARMSAKDKAEQSKIHKNDWKTANRNWTSLAKKHPDQKAAIQKNKLVAQIKMIYGKDALSDKKKKDLNKWLASVAGEGRDFGQYWGY